jgi:hypothetical protein
LQHHRARNRDALALAAGELVWIADARIKAAGSEVGAIKRLD